MSVFISGASSGIGKASAEAFAAAKQNLVLVARRKERLATLRKELVSRYDVEIDIFALDVQDRVAIDELFDKNRDVLSRVEVLVNNAGLAIGRAPIQEADPKEWDVVSTPTSKACFT